MPWDEAAARGATEDFHRKFQELKGQYPEAIGKLQALWQESFARCGHKRLGRVVLGKSVDEACQKHGD